MCPSGQFCSAGTCSVTCGSLAVCDPGGGGALYCANLKTDNANCGSCGTVCGTGQVCSAGVCSLSCGSLKLCDPGGGGPVYCSDLKSDSANCGACFSPCPTGKVCSGGVCGSSCPSPLSICGTSCTDTRYDPSNCGACSTVCSLPSATAACLSGSCVVGVCAAGYANCDGVASNGCEVNLKTSATNCGSCGKTCGSGLSCVAGTCASATYTTTVSYTGGGCAICGGATGAYSCIYSPGTTSSFTDPLPAGPKAVSVTVNVYEVGCGAGATTVSINGTVIGTYTPTANCSCSTCDAAATVTLSNSAGIPGWIYGGTNSLKLAPASGGPCVNRADIIVTAG